MRLQKLLQRIPQQRRRRKKQRTYGTKLPRRYALMLALLFTFSALFTFGAIRFSSYLREHNAAKQTSQALREVYYSVTPEAVPSPLTTTKSVPSPLPTQMPAKVSATPDARLLPVIPYEGNPYAIISSRFRELRKLNKDIIGWITISDLIDEAVVHKDNTTYLDKDYLGNPNSNGAIFLDQHCTLSSRPYTYILYGHNMKTGAMFGGLRSYENLAYFKNHPFISFETGYESARYVVFAAGTVSTDPDSWQYLDLTRLCSPLGTLRSEAIQKIKTLSVFNCPLDVKEDDQILILMTCVDDSAERRILAARRIQNNESEKSLQDTLAHTHIK